MGNTAGNRRLSEKDITVFTRQLAMMLRSGLPMVETLTLMEKSAASFPVRSLLHQLRGEIMNGRPLSDALGRHIGRQEPILCHIAYAGEQSGSLDIVLERLADQKEKTFAAKRRLKTALIRPAITLFITIAVMTFILPGLTALLITLAVIAALLWGRHLYRTSPEWRDRFMRILLRLPILGDIMKKIIIARWCRTMATLYGAGVLLSAALDATIKVTGISLYDAVTSQMRDQVANGSSLSHALKQTHVFPPLVTQMAHEGEQSGMLDSALNKSAEYLEMEAEESIKRLFSIMEPVLLVFLACLVAYALISTLSLRLESLP